MYYISRQMVLKHICKRFIAQGMTKVFVQSLKQIGRICALSSCQNSTQELGMKPSLSQCCSFYDLVLPIQCSKFLSLIFSELELTSSGWEMCVCSSNSYSNFLSSRRDPFSIFAFPILQLEIFQFMICAAFTFMCICVLYLCVFLPLGIFYQPTWGSTVSLFYDLCGF